MTVEKLDIRVLDIVRRWVAEDKIRIVEGLLRYSGWHGADTL